MGPVIMLRASSTVFIPNNVPLATLEMLDIRTKKKKNSHQPRTNPELSSWVSRGKLSLFPEIGNKDHVSTKCSIHAKKMV